MSKEDKEQSQLGNDKNLIQQFKEDLIKSFNKLIATAKIDLTDYADRDEQRDLKTVQKISAQSRKKGDPNNLKLLILSSDTGDGHNSAARAIQTAFVEEYSGYAEIVDIFSFLSEGLQNFVSDNYASFVTKYPASFGLFYGLGEWLSDKVEDKSIIYQINTLFSNNLEKYVRYKDFDGVLCTHMFAMDALTKLDLDSEINLPSFAVITDYTAYPFMQDVHLDYIFSPSPKISEELRKKGLRTTEFINTGIPVDKKFSSDLSKEEARAALNIHSDKDMLLIMGGGSGFGKQIPLIESLNKELDDCIICALTGKNEKLLKEIEHKFKNNENVMAVPFTNKVFYYMRASDVLLTKPGGISSTEAGVTNIPIIHTSAIPGVESKNREFFYEHGFSLKTENIEEATKAAKYLLENDTARLEMLKRQKEFFNKDAATDIAKFIKLKLEAEQDF